MSEENCGHPSVVNITKFNMVNRWIEVGYCGACDRLVWVGSNEDWWKPIKLNGKTKVAG